MKFNGHGTETKDLSHHIEKEMKKAGVEVPAKLSEEIAGILHTVRRDEIQRVLQGHFSSVFKAQP